MARRPRLLDLFCCEGGGARGYHAAGFDIVGIDIRPQPRYPYRFIQGDALAPPVRLASFDAVHASPPCQAYSALRSVHPDKDYPDLMAATLAILATFDGPWVVENVEGAPMPNATVICGAALGLIASDEDAVPLVLRRHRRFASNMLLLSPGCGCSSYRGTKTAGVYGHGRWDNDGSGNRRGGYQVSKATGARLMGLDVDRMTKHGLNQAIPPAYTELIGRQLMAAVAPRPTGAAPSAGWSPWS